MPSRWTRTVGSWCLGGASVCAPIVVGGCSQPTVEPDLRSDLPQERILGLAAAMRAHDDGALPEYGTLLRSDEPAGRMFASAALEDRSGEKVGDHYGDPHVKRDEAVERWERWVEEHRTEIPPPENAEI